MKHTNKPMHTPGPWAVRLNHSASEHTRYLIAEDTNELETVRANARLICAAPCLLAALETLLAETADIGSSLDSYVAAAEAVLKARGES